MIPMALISGFEPREPARDVRPLSATWWGVALTVLLTNFVGSVALAESGSKPTCEYGVPKSAHRDGINKTYCGRQISHIMGWQGSSWLERPSRSAEEGIPLLMERLGLQAGMVVADYGAGTGYLTRRFADKVGPTGTVWAVDIQPQMITQLEKMASGFAKGQIKVSQSTAKDSRLPLGTLDMAVMVDVYHELEYPKETLESLVNALKPGGQLVFIEYRPNDPDVPIKQLHTMSVEQVRKEAESAGLQFLRTDGLLWQNMIRFEKPVN